MDLKTVAGPLITFDPTKIIEIYQAPFSSVFPFQPGAPTPGDGPIKTYVVGIGSTGTAVTASVDEVLNIVEPDPQNKKFITLTIGSGKKIWIRATAIEWLLPTYPGENDPSLHCFINVSDQAGHGTGVQEDMKLVKDMVNQIREKENDAVK